jgi:D-arabinose 1-dehydrogenase-like Zn-dependent alcohol dehydrogenase
MLAGRLDVATGTFGIDELPVPDPGPGQVRIAVKAAGVCLSDVHLIEGMLNPAHLAGDSVTLGHEVSGVIDALGPGVTGWQPGQRVLLIAEARRRRTAPDQGRRLRRRVVRVHPRVTVNARRHSR